MTKFPITHPVSEEQREKYGSAFVCCESGCAELATLETFFSDASDDNTLTCDKHDLRLPANQ